MITADGTSTIEVKSDKKGDDVRAIDKSSGIEVLLSPIATMVHIKDHPQAIVFPTAKTKALADILNAAESARAERKAATT